MDWQTIKTWTLSLLKHIASRLFLTSVLVCSAFVFVVLALFDLQIANGKHYQETMKATISKSIPILAPRGEIFDRNGRPLAINETAFSVKIDTSVQIKNANEVYYRLLKQMHKQNETIVVDFPISKEINNGQDTNVLSAEEDPLNPQTSKVKVRNFLLNNSEPREIRWKKDMGVPEDANAQETYEYLLEFFDIPQEWSTEEKEQVLALRSAVFMQRYDMKPVTVCMQAKPETVAALEEENQDYPGVYIDMDYLRRYPETTYASHILGYIRSISQEEYAEQKQFGYTMSDLIGKDGIEKAFESELRGKNGQTIVELGAGGRRVGADIVVEPQQGNSIFLTIDIELQKEVTKALEKQLSQILVNKLLGKSRTEKPITVTELLASMLNANNIDVSAILQAEPKTFSGIVKSNVLLKLPQNENDPKFKESFQTALHDMILRGTITSTQMIGVLVDQKIITITDDEMDRLKKGWLTPLTFIVSKIESGEITPAMTNLNPATGSAVVVDVNTGETLAAVSYPSYDNNEFVNHFNNDYFYKLNNDPTTPMVNRPFAEPRAPGSTFKMITALSGLSQGVITPTTKIYDEIYFKKAGAPYPRCWNHGLGSHGYVTVAGALEVSCNYFFFETAYRLGNTQENTKLEGIAKLNETMTKFGLNSPTGVEIHELNWGNTAKQTYISSPAYKDYVISARAAAKGQVATASDIRWVDGETLGTAIGQAYNNYTSATMAKYVATLANGGTRYQMHLLDKIQTPDGQLVSQFKPVVEETLNLDPKHLQAVYDGMLLVTGGKNGTAKSVFEDFPMQIPGKTGTAQQDIGGSDHASFACFAPYKNPQIAIYVCIPYGNTNTTVAPAAQVAKNILNSYFGLDDKPQPPTYNRLVE